MRKPTDETYKEFQDAFDHFNENLFDGELDQCLITMQRKHGSFGFFCAERFHERADNTITVDEIALNPAAFEGHADEKILSTLVHEMSHLWQSHFGHPGRGRYHNKEWARKMHELGLFPSHTGEPGGKETGDRVSHYVIPGGRYQRAYRKLQEQGFRLTWAQARIQDGTQRPTRVKYTCRRCRLAVWAKPRIRLLCGECVPPERMFPWHREHETATRERRRLPQVDLVFLRCGACAITLGITWPATEPEVREAYRKIALRCHPDKGGTATDFKKATAAYEYLIGALEKQCA